MASTNRFTIRGTGKLLAPNEIVLGTPASRAISAKHNEHRFLGPSKNDVTPLVNGGAFQAFSDGSVYWTPTTGAHEVHGDILAKWGSLGWEKSFLGYPTTDETATPDSVGRFNFFQGGAIYWTPTTGAHEVHGDILAKWGSLGYERSFLGYPTSDEGDIPGGRVSNFERGQIAWSASKGALVSSTTVENASAGGIRPQSTSSGSSAIDVRRTVTGSASMDLTDHETFGSNEHNSGSATAEVVLSSEQPGEVMNFIVKAGGEMRVEFRLTGAVKNSGDVILSGNAKLYEGTSEQTDDLDGQEDVSILVPRDGFRSFSITVRNTDEGGDFADIRANFSNRAV